MILPKEIATNAKMYYDQYVRYMTEKFAKGELDPVLNNMYRIKYVAMANVEPVDIATPSTTYQKDECIFVANSITDRMIEEFGDVDIPMLSTGIATNSPTGLRYYVLSVPQVHNKIQEVIELLYKIGIQCDAPVELEYLMMNRTPSDIGELYV